MTGIPVYEPVFETLRRRNIDVLHCTVIGIVLRSQVLGRWSIASIAGGATRQRLWC